MSGTQMAVNRFVKGPCASFCVTVYLELCVCVCVWPQELYVGLWDWSLGSSSWQGVCHSYAHVYLRSPVPALQAGVCVQLGTCVCGSLPPPAAGPGTRT